METVVTTTEEDVVLDENTVYTKEEEVTDTMFVQEGPLVIPFAGTVVFQDGDGNYQQYIINDCPTEKPEESIVYYAGDYVEGEEEEEDEEEEEEPQSDDSRMEVQQPLYQYAILSNGKLHLQTIDSNDQLTEIEDEGLQAQIDALQQSIKLDEAPLDLDKITGRNLITGQTVTLDSYLNKIQNRFDTETKTGRKRKNSDENELINKKVLIGKTASGKKIIGKILHVQTNRNVEDNVETPENSSDNTEPEEKFPKPHIIIKKHVITRENFDSNIGKTLTGLMDLETVQHKLKDKNLVVKLIDKVYEFGTDNFSKTISYVYGHMDLVEDSEGQLKWCFILHNEPYETTNSDDTEGNDEDKSPSENEATVTDVSLQMEETSVDSNDTVPLSILTVVDREGKKSTRVNLNSQQPKNKCQSCNKEFKTAVQVRKHISNVHLSERWVFCDVCGRSFTNETFLQRHKKIHVRGKWYKCPECPKSFNAAGSLKRHLTVHNPSLRPLECSVCIQRFTDESSLRKHLVIHTGIRAYQCESCSRAFRNQSDLNFHRRIHDPLKQFSCDVCGRAFSRQSNMLRHAEIHRGSGALHRCHICGCSYSFISSLTRHIVQKHISEQQQQE